MTGKPQGKQQWVVRPLNSVGLFKETMAHHYNDVRTAAETGRTKVAWCTSLGPVELLRALGFKLFFPENHGAILGSTRASSEFIPVASAHGYSPEICSYLTSDIGSYLKGKTPLDQLYGMKGVPRPDVLVYNTNQCKDVTEWFTFFAKEFKVPIYGIASPHHVPEVSIAHVHSVEQQMHTLSEQLERIVGTRLDMGVLKRVVGLSHDACMEWKACLAMAAKRPSPLTFYDAIIHMGPAVVLRGTQKAVDYYKAFKLELEQRVKDGLGAIQDEKYRLYWDGMPIWGRIRAHSDLLAKYNTCIVASTYCNTWALDKLDSNAPFTSMAEAYTGIFLNRTEEIKEKYLVDMVKEFHIDGLIFHDAKTCPYNSNTRYGMPQRLEKWFHIPNLVVHGDVCDMRFVSDTQFETGVEAFIERLMLKKVEGGTL